MRRALLFLALVACRRDGPAADAAVPDAGIAVEAPRDATVDVGAPAPAAPIVDAGKPLPARAKLAGLAKGAVIAASNGQEHVVTAEAETPVLIASFTKLFVAVATLRLVARGIYGLDDTVKTLLPALASRPWSDSTVRELLTHTSRVPEFDEGHGYYRKDGVDFGDPVAVLAKELSASATEKRGVWKYRNAEFALLGAILQERAGKPTAEVLANEVFTPARMHHAGILVAGKPPSGLDLAPMGAIRPQNFFVAGNGYASPEDLLAFLDALGDDTLLDGASRELLFTGTKERKGGAMGCWSYPFGGQRMVERPGGFGNIRLVSAFFPDERRAIVAWSKDAPELGRPRDAKSAAAALARVLAE